MARLLLGLFIMAPIRPALSAAQWRCRRFGALSVESAGQESYLAIDGADGELMTLRGASELFAMMALANDAMPGGDARKFTITDAAVCRLVMERVAAMESEEPLATLVRSLCAKIDALLPREGLEGDA